MSSRVGPATTAHGIAGAAQPRVLQLLFGTDEALLREVLGLARFVRFRRGDALIRQGDRLAVLVILKGYAAVRRMSPDGRRYTTLLTRPGHVVGLASIARPQDAQDDLVGLTDGMAALLPGVAMRRLAARDAGLALRLFDLGAGVADVVGQRLDQATFDSAQRRVATILLSYEDLLAEACPVISRTELASLAGTSREMLGVVVRALEAAGAVRRVGRAIVVEDRSQVHDIAGWESCGAEHVRALTIPPLAEPVEHPPRTSTVG
ncbi:MAG TPA: Crp/Fnr family transcriptional regulator [Candidatus Limnocylindrales bacterium]|nr:Crp/Fnr family transcriptional regulator [Candidatus Limnocylindrales bacterium]